MIIADYVTTYELNLTALYLLVTLLVSWFCGLWWGLVFAALSMFSQIEVSGLLGSVYSKPFYLYVSNANNAFSYLIVTLLTAGFRALYIREQSLARVDYLTRAGNMQAYYERIEVETARQRRDGKPFAVAVMDCDHFKLINDDLGHHEGDHVLQVIAATIRSNIRKTDLLARLGGDKFGVVFSHVPEFEALQAIKKLRMNVEAAMDRNSWPITLSVGVAIFPSSEGGVSRVVSFCDELNKQAKAAGRNRVVHRVYDPSEDSSSQPPRLAAN